MKALVCELCGSNDFAIQDGLYICQSCGTKYEPEPTDAKTVASSVANGEFDEVENLKVLAARAMEVEDYEKAADYYDAALLKRPNDWEMVFNRARCGIYDDRGSSSMLDNYCTFERSYNAVYMLIKDTYRSVDDRIKAVETVTARTIEFTEFDNSMLSHELLRLRVSANGARSQLDLLQRMTIETLIACGENNAIVMHDHKRNAALNDLALQCYVKALGLLDKSPDIYFAVKDEYREKLLKLARQVDPDYEPPVVEEDEKHCYVATAVYGSYDCPQVWVLRRFRDFSLAKTLGGRAFIRFYYAISPKLVKRFGSSAWFRSCCKRPLDALVARCRVRGYSDEPYDDRGW